MQRHPSETENKLLLLHAIDRLGAATSQQLLSFVVENELMDYISLQLGLAELDESGFLRKQPHALGTLYALTGKGHDALMMTMLTGTAVMDGALLLIWESTEADFGKLRFREVE